MSVGLFLLKWCCRFQYKIMNLRPLTKELQEKAERELHEVPSRVEEDIRHIQEWIAQQPHLRARTDPQWILTFLRGCKFSLAKTKEKIDTFYTMRTLMPEIFKNRDPFLPEMQELLQLRVGGSLSKTLDPAGPRILFARAEGVGTQHHWKTIMKLLLMAVDLIFLEDDNFVIGGQHLFVDWKNASYALATSVDFKDAKQLEILLEHGYPSRPQSFDAINTPWFIEPMLNLIKPILSKKVKERIHIYNINNLEEISNVIPLSHLPKDYGGEGESFEEIRVYWKNKIESYRDWFLEDGLYGVDESKRPKNQPSRIHLDCIEGSFRKLDLD